MLTDLLSEQILGYFAVNQHCRASGLPSTSEGKNLATEISFEYYDKDIQLLFFFFWFEIFYRVK